MLPYNEAKQHQEEAVLAILTRTEKSIYAAMHNYARKPFETAELYAQGVLVVLECIESYEESTGVPFLAYVHTQLKYHYLRTHRVRPALSLNAETDDGESTLLDLLAADDDPEAEVLKNEEREAVRRALLALTDRERKCVEGFYFRNLSLSEIAHSLGIAYRTAYNNKTRALKKLKAALSDDIQDTPVKGERP